MSSRGRSEGRWRPDPENDLFWRFDMRRLTAEEIRDSILAVSGNLNLKMYGPSIYPEIPQEVLAGQSVPGNGWAKSPPRGAAAAQRLRPRQALAAVADPGGLRPRRDRPPTPGALHDDAADAGARHAQRRFPQRAGRGSSPTPAPRGRRRPRPPGAAGAVGGSTQRDSRPEAEVDRGVALHRRGSRSKDGLQADEALERILSAGAEPERVYLPGLTRRFRRIRR